MVDVECGGDVQVDIECHDSMVRALGSVTVTRGGVIGGLVQAAGQLSAGFIGSEMCVATRVEAGHDPATAEQVAPAREVLARARELLRNLQAALGPYLDRPESTTGLPLSRRSQIAQLQVRVDEARAAVRHAQNDLLRQAPQGPGSGASLSSRKQVFPRVTVVLDSLCEEEIATELSGPVKMVADRAQAAIKLLSGRPSAGAHAQSKARAM